MTYFLIVAFLIWVALGSSWWMWLRVGAGGLAMYLLFLLALHLLKGYGAIKRASRW